jgi:hypothetical protein
MNLFSDDVTKLKSILEQFSLGSTERVNDILYRWNDFVSSSAVDINNSTSVYGWMVDLEDFVNTFSGSLLTLLSLEMRDIDTIYRVGPVTGAAANAVWVIVKPTLDIINRLILLPQGKANLLYDFRRDNAYDYVLSMEPERTLGDREDSVNFISTGSWNSFTYDRILNNIVFVGNVSARDVLIGLNNFGEGAEVLIGGNTNLFAPITCQGSVVLLVETNSVASLANTGWQANPTPEVVQSAGINAINVPVGGYTIGGVASTDVLVPFTPQHLVITVTDGDVVNFINATANSLLHIKVTKLYSYNNAVTFTLREYLLGQVGWDISSTNPRWMIFADFNQSGGGSLIHPAMVQYGVSVGTAFTLNQVEMFSVQAWRKFLEGLVLPIHTDIFKLNYYRQFYRLLQSLYYNFLASNVDDFY